MYLFLQLVPIMFLLIMVFSIMGFIWALLGYNNIKLAITLFIVSLAMVLPMLASAQVVATHTEQNLVITESGKVTEVIANVHSVDFGDDVVTYTYRDGRVGQMATSIDRRVDVQNAHLYKK